MTQKAVQLAGDRSECGDLICFCGQKTRLPKDTLNSYLHVIQSTNLEGVFIYTKGKLTKRDGADIYYFLISAKRSVQE